MFQTVLDFLYHVGPSMGPLKPKPMAEVLATFTTTFVEKGRDTTSDRNVLPEGDTRCTCLARDGKSSPPLPPWPTPREDDEDEGFRMTHLPLTDGTDHRSTWTLTCWARTSRACAARLREMPVCRRHLCPHHEELCVRGLYASGQPILTRGKSERELA